MRSSPRLPPTCQVPSAGIDASAFSSSADAVHGNPPGPSVRGRAAAAAFVDPFGIAESSPGSAGPVDRERARVFVDAGGVAGASGSTGTSASASATARADETASSRMTDCGSRPASTPLNDVCRTCPSRVQPPSSARMTSSGRIQVMPFRSPPQRPRQSRGGGGSNGGASVASGSIAASSRFRVAAVNPDPTLPANRSLPSS